MTVSTGRRTPRADCTAGPGGGITFDLDLGRREDEEAPELLLRLRGAKGKGDGDTVRLQLSPLRDGRLRAVLPGTLEPAEGRWDVYLREPGAQDGEAVAVEPGIRDLRLLVDQVAQSGRIAVRIPYPTLDGRLAVRCWLRTPHAEAGPVTFDGHGMTVGGTLYGTGLGAGARVEARAPGADGRVLRVPVTGDGEEGTFAFTLPLDELADGAVTEPRLWTLWLIPGTAEDGPAGGVRISRILDDVWDRKKIFVYPGRSTGEGSRATPCYTTDNDLCVRLEPEPAP
ncbi:transferase [Streptomyces sp. NBC_01732]|uniref:transferase n=1 Tax=unclassified Streptomyces TaxID=2593676 RepID=UPI00352D6033|nr:transferase [Streptomyces sp. NBC_01732]